jgi:C4-dicarboxylate-specific signal transduction histidine kinase
LINARDVITEREIESPQIKIIIEARDCTVFITISDNAGGIPENIINRIFDPYFTTKGPQQGTGIGLFMSKTIIENNMGGKLSVQNTAKGAEFRIEVRHEPR